MNHSTLSLFLIFTEDCCNLEKCQQISGIFCQSGRTESLLNSSVRSFFLNPQDFEDSHGRERKVVSRPMERGFT